MFSTSLPSIFFIIMLNHFYFNTFVLLLQNLETVRLLLLFNDYSSHFNDYPNFLFFIFSFVVLPQSITTTIAKICPILPHKVLILLHFHSPAVADEKHSNAHNFSFQTVIKCRGLRGFADFSTKSHFHRICGTLRKILQIRAKHSHQT